MCTWHGALPPPFEASHLPPPLWGRVARRRQGYGGLAHSPAEAQRRRVGEGVMLRIEEKSPTRHASARRRVSTSPQGGGEKVPQGCDATMLRHGQAGDGAKLWGSAMNRLAVGVTVLLL